MCFCASMFVFLCGLYLSFLLQYELLFSVAEKENPPSLPIILSLMKQYPNVSAQVFQGDHFGEKPHWRLFFFCYVPAPFSVLD